MNETPSDTILDEVAQRGLRFLGAVSHNPYIRAALDKRGYTDEEHDRGWSLVLKASGYHGPKTTVAPGPDKAAQLALTELDAWDEPNFRVARAALVTFPDQQAFVFDNLEAATGAGAIVSISTFFDRLEELESGPDRKATRAQDHAALKKLAARGITGDEGKRLRKLIEIAKRGVSSDSIPAPVTTPKERTAAKIALYEFLTEWTEVAKADIKRRDFLIQMGLGKRKKKAKEEVPTGGGGGGTGGGGGGGTGGGGGGGGK